MQYQEPHNEIGTVVSRWQQPINSLYRNVNDSQKFVPIRRKSLISLFIVAQVFFTSVHYHFSIMTTELIDGVYRRIHKRYNLEQGVWETYIPNKGEPREPEDAAFNLIYQQASPRSGLGASKLVEVHDETLKDTLGRCLPWLDTFTGGDDENEYGYEDEDDGDGDEEEKPNHYLEINAKTLAVHYDVLQAEWVRLQALLQKSEGTETTINGDLQACEGQSEAVIEVEDQKDTWTEYTDKSESLQVSNLAEHLNCLEKLLLCIDREFSGTKRKFSELMSRAAITYDLLWYLFRHESIIIFADPNSGATMAGQVVASTYEEIPVKKFDITVKYIDYSGTTLHYSRQHVIINYFPDVADIDSLAAQPLNDEQLRQHLTSRGRAFVQLQGRHYMEYHDFLIVRGNWGQSLRFAATGRAMVDASAYRKMNHQGYGNQPGKNDRLTKVPDSEFLLCSSTVLGYSFVTKTWGRLLVDKFTPIVWAKEAFNHLVLPQPTKLLIQSLVRANRTGTKVINDVIAGKGGGCIIVLHGRPGTGKTLTAEAVAEEQEKPLLTVSVGDLGTDAASLERNLTEILELGALWDAVLLLDEADIFLEARSLHELQRNAMVGVFLRLLEYHQRVMFLTTNRVKTFDEAFKSRISVAIQYRDLDENARRAIWENFLRLTGMEIVDGMPDQTAVPFITAEDVNRLASKRLNGREIKNTVRTAQALAKSSKQHLSYDLILVVLGIVEQFDADLNDREIVL